jgi:hypothetical protein
MHDLPSEFRDQLLRERREAKAAADTFVRICALERRLGEMMAVPPSPYRADRRERMGGHGWGGAAISGAKRGHKPDDV